MSILIKIDNQEFNLDKTNETFYATQEQIAKIFDINKSGVSRHIDNILKENELDNSVCAKFATTASDGKKYNVEHYNLDMIIAVGYRVNSKKATQFRKKATAVIKEYLTTGEVKKKEYSKLEIARMLVEAEEEKERLQIINQKQEAVIQEYFAIDENKTYTDIAKILHLPPLKYITALKKMQYIRENRIPYQKYIDSGYFTIKKTVKEYGGLTKHFESYLITPKGFQYFSKKFNKISLS